MRKGKGSILRILSATTVAGLMASTMLAPVVMASSAPITLTVTINGTPQTVTLPSNLGPGLYDLQLPATVSGHVVELPPVEFVISVNDVATLVQSAAPSAVTVDAPGPNTGASPTRMTATFTSSGGVTTTESIPASEFKPLTDAVTFRPVGTLAPGIYQLTVQFQYADGSTTTSSAQSYAATNVDVPATLSATNTAAVSAAASGTVTETFLVTDQSGIGVAGVAVDLGVTGTLSIQDLSTTSAVTNAAGVVTVTYDEPSAGHSGTLTGAVASNPSLQGQTGLISIGTASTSAQAASVTEITTPLASGATLTLGQANTITFEAENSAGAGVSGVTVDLSLTGNLGTVGQLSSPTAVTGVGGIATVTYTPSAMTTGGVAVGGTVFAALAANTAINGQTGTLTVGADAPASVSAGVTSAQVTAGTTDTLTYTVRDSAGHLLAGVPVTATVTDGGLGSSLGATETVSTNAEGVATFIYDGPDLVGTGTLQATAGSVSAGTSIAVVPGSPARLALGSPTSAELVGVTYQIPVYLADQYGNPITATTSQTVDLFGSVFLPSPSGDWSSYGAFSPSTDFLGPTASPGSPNYDVLPLQFVNGSAAVYFKPMDSTLGQSSDTFGVALPVSGGGAPLSVAVASGISVSAAGEAPSTVVSNFRASVASAGADTPVTFTVLAADGNPIPGVSVEFQPITPGIGYNSQFGELASLFASTNAQGQATAKFIGNQAGSTGVVTATTGGGTAAVSGETGLFTVVPGAPAAISASFGSGQAPLLAGTSQPVQFTVYDRMGNPVPNTPVTFGVNGLTGYVSRDGEPAASGLSNASGAFTVTYTPNPGTSAGTGYLWAAASGVVTSAGSMTYTPPSAWAAVNMGYTGAESGSTISSGSTVVPSGTTTSATVSGLDSQTALSLIATVDNGLVSLATPQFLPITSSGGTAEGTGAVWFPSNASAEAWNLTGEVGVIGGTIGYSDFVLTQPGSSASPPPAISGSLVSVGSGGALVTASLPSGIVSEPIARLSSSGIWSLVAPNVQDYWVVYQGQYYQLDVSTP